MASQNVLRLEKLRTPPPWVRGLYIAALALITFSWAPQGGTRIYARLAFLWILALVALLFLVRLWRTTVSPRR
jgi:hypothetical protein